MLETREIERWERLTAAMLRHAAEGDPEAFAQVVRILDDARAELPAVCARLRHGYPSPEGECRPIYSWDRIGRALGISRQSAAERFRVR